MKPTRLALLVAAALAPSFAHALVTGPYSVDANTLHLWHLDETSGPAVDSAHYAYSGSFTSTADANRPLTAPFGTGTLGAASATGFGNAYSGGATPNTAGLAALTPANSTSDNVDHTFDNPTTHAFTFEAIIQVGFNPSANLTTPQEIIAGEGDAADSSDRSWQFRIQPNTSAGTTPWVLRFQKVSGFGGGPTGGGDTANFNLDANIPSAGVNAIAQGEWYHVAVTFDGAFASANNLKLYWTKVDPLNTTASLIGSGQMNGWLRQQDTDFSLGNELRDFNGNTEGFFGKIDEVRISDIARTDTQFIFAAVPEPSSCAAIAGVLALGAVALRRRRR